MTRDQSPSHDTIPIEELAARVSRAVCRSLRVSSPSEFLSNSTRDRIRIVQGSRACLPAGLSARVGSQQMILSLWSHTRLPRQLLVPYLYLFLSDARAYTTALVTYGYK